MMWDWLASGPASGATLLLYDGSPLVAGGRILWDYAQSESVTHFGTSAKYLDALMKSGIKPREQYDLRDLRVLHSTGSPLAPESFDYVYAHIKSDVQLSSISGGTDILSCFVLGNPTLPVYRGEIQCRGLGLAVDVWNGDGRPVRQKKGELVCTRPFPSMPLGFWNDVSSERYSAAFLAKLRHQVPLRTVGTDERGRDELGPDVSFGQFLLVHSTNLLYRFCQFDIPF